VQDSLLDKGLKISDISVDYYKDYYLRLFNEMETHQRINVWEAVSNTTSAKEMETRQQ